MFDRLFNRGRAKDDRQRQFEAWPPAPSPRGDVHYPRLDELTALDPENGPAAEQEYDSALVIGLGHTGERVLRHWLEQLASGTADPRQAVRAMLITEDSQEPLPAALDTVRQFDLSTRSSPGGGRFGSSYHRSRRAAMREKFRAPDNYRQFQSSLQISLAGLDRDVRIVVVGSLAEPAGALLGEVLQALRLEAVQRGELTLFLGVTALFSLTTVGARLEEEEVFAALREAGRFTFSGWHWMEPPIGASDTVIRSALLDHLFLLEAPTSTSFSLMDATADAGVDQALAEALSSLLHPAAITTFWEHLLNEVQTSGRVRNLTQEPVVSNLSVATLQAPLPEMTDYVAARLAYAAIYGERTDDQNEGLFAPAEQGAAGEHAEVWLARRWLSQNGPGSHPVFEWLLDLEGPSDLRHLPSLSEEFVNAFQRQLAYGLVSYLNDPLENPRLSLAREALAWLSERLGLVTNWFQEATGDRPNDGEVLTLQFLLRKWSETASILLRQVKEWEDVLRKPPEAGRSSHSRRRSRRRYNRRRSEKGAVAGRSLHGVFQQHIEQAEDALSAAAGGEFCRALTADDEDSLREARTYYEETIRPELTRAGRENSLAFRQVRERLGWWVGQKPGEPPRLFLVCIPPSFEAPEHAVVPPEEARFASLDMDELAQALLELGVVQAQGRSGHLTGKWFRQRLERLHPFLSKAKRPLLRFDATRARQEVYKHGHSVYLFGHNKSVTGSHKGAIFSDTLPSEINEVDEYEPTRLTALSLWYNIPLPALAAWQQTLDAYHYQEELQLYPQEQGAARYERRIRSLTREKALLPSSLTMALVDQQLVSYFCQAAFYGIVTVRRDEFDQNPVWVVQGVEGFSPLPLAKVGESGDAPLSLLKALEAFALRLPNQPELRRRPTHPFHPQRRDAFLDALHQAIEKKRRQGEGARHRQQFEEKYLHTLQRQAQKGNALASGFHKLLQVELDEPLWRDE